MPQIKQYEAPQLGLQPSEKGVDAQAAAGRLIGRFYNQAGEDMRQAGSDIGGGIKAAGDAAVDYEAHQQITVGSAHAAELFDNLNQSRAAALKDINPSDPGYGPKAEIAIKQWRENTLGPSLEQFREGFTTENSQKWADHFIDTTRQHMFTQSATDITQAASLGIHNSIHATVSVASNAAMRDPTSVDAQLSLLDHAVTGAVDSSPVKGIDGAKIRSDILEKGRAAIIKSAAQGDIAKAADPEARADYWAKRYPEYISGAELKTLASNASSEVRARNYDYELNRRRDKEIATDKSNAKFDDYYVAAKSQDPRIANDPIAQKALHDPDLLKGDKSKLITLIDRQLKPETDARVSAQTSAQLFRMMADPNADPAKVRQAIIDARSKDPGQAGSLSETDYNGRMKDLEDLKTPEGVALARDRGEFIKRYTIAVGGKDYESGLKNAAGEESLYRLEIDAKRMEGVLKKANQDPHSLYDSSSPNFLGRPSFLEKYQTSMQDKVNGMRGEINAHTDLNLFSSGRAEQMGVKGGIGQNIVPITAAGQTVQVNQSAAPHFKGFLDELQARGYKIDEIGGYDPRTKRGSFTSASEHAYGNAIDINASRNQQGGRGTDMPSDVAAMAARHGLIWGGEWNGSSRDPMHFEWSGKNVPESKVAAGSVRISSKAEYDKLSAGAQYTAPDGSLRIKGQ